MAASCRGRFAGQVCLRPSGQCYLPMIGKGAVLMESYFWEPSEHTTD